MSLFGVGQYYPHIDHEERIKRYKENRLLFLGKHYDVFLKVQNRLTAKQKDLIYISANLPAIICKKSADFLFGEAPHYSAGKNDNSAEQKAIERIVQTNHLNITNYESSLANSYRGDSFYKVIYGQEYGGAIDKKFDPLKVMIQAQNPEFVFPETVAGNAKKVLAYHIAIPYEVQNTDGREYILDVESHYAGFIKYHKYRMNPLVESVDGTVLQWKIYAQMDDDRGVVETGVNRPLVVHVPNFALDDDWQGISDIDDMKALFDEVNNRLSRIAEILDKHADPAIAVPAGTLGEDEHGNPIFRVGVDKVFEVMGKDDIKPEYITWDGQLQSAFEELKQVLSLIFVLAELPQVALGGDNAGTSGSSGLSIKFRMNSLLAKINRKRQYYDKGLKEVLEVAQMLEHARLGKQDYQITVPRITFKDGLPDDEMEEATIAQLLVTAGLRSKKTAIMRIDDMTEEQAEAELKRIEEEQETADIDAFNTEGETPLDRNMKEESKEDDE